MTELINTIQIYKHEEGAIITAIIDSIHRWDFDELHTLLAFNYQVSGMTLFYHGPVFCVNYDINNHDFVQEIETKLTEGKYPFLSLIQK
ncbi:hypothetical protein [Spirosoma sp.]|uniref:hypothetical protein n=1 Tax=Spirosoma sp. TaxID=1899569 RepID=UPI00262A294A|nr:hypothetical protein [Spirosoma sp.]MCX6218373.1 hypothetical protein [Spirosoma sp.]